MSYQALKGDLFFYKFYLTFGRINDYNIFMFGFYEKYFTLFGLDIAYYGLIIAIGMAIGVFFACKNAKYRGLKSDDIILVACYTLPFAIIGARLYFVLFSLDSFHSFWEIFEIWNGGMAIYGGIIGGAIGLTLYCLIHKKNFLDVADIAVISIAFGQAMGRWGNFINQEAYGRYVSNPSAHWFPISVYIKNCNQAGCLCGGHGWHMATFFYESMWDLMTFAILLILLRKNKLKLRGSLMCFYLIIYGIGRSWIEGLRMDSLMIGPLRTSQFLSILLIAFAMSFILISYFLNKKGKIKSLAQLGLGSEIVEKQKSNDDLPKKVKEVRQEEKKDIDEDKKNN